MSSKQKQHSKENALNDVFGALSDQTRRAILDRLTQSPASMGELAQPFDMSLAAIGKHVRVLESAGLINRQVNGRVHMCILNAAAMNVADDWLNHYREYWIGSLDALADYVESSGDS